MSVLPTEAQVEDLVLDFLRELGCSVACGADRARGEVGAERSDYRDVVLPGRLERVVSALNPDLPVEAVAGVVNTVLRAESQSLMEENWRAYQLLVYGVPVQFRAADGATRDVRARLVNWDEPRSNDLVAVNQFTVQGRSERRPDVMLFVNGLPLVLLELKRPGDAAVSLRGAFNQVGTYVNEIPEAFTWNQVTVISDGVMARA